ncbi:MAG: M3 family metallopeptidase [Gammaproteobacteria bacterium]|nr:M3 family metallopeptidase [Gammaproteobacteria bacterium]
MPANQNPLLFDHGLPPFSQLDPKYAVEAVEVRIAEANSAIEAALSVVPATWASLVAPIERAQDNLGRTWSPIGHLHAVVDSEDWREAYKACLPLLTDFHTQFGQNRALFEAYDAFANSDEFKDLGAPEQRAVNNALRDFRLSGVHLNEDAKQEYAEISQQLSKLGAKFSENVLDATQAWTQHITDAKQLAGLPDSALALLSENAKRVDKDGWLITLDFPSYFAVMTHADNRELREGVYRAYVTRASEFNDADLNNRPVIDEILSLRHQSAVILGFDSYASLSVETKMAPNAQAVFDFLDELAQRAKPVAEGEIAALQAFATDSGGPASLEAWDVSYYSEKLKTRDHAVSQEALRPYFPLDACLRGMFAIVERLYGIEIRPRTDIDTWHDDVQFFELHHGGQLRGQFFLDAYARHGKRGGAWMGECRGLRQSANEVPVAYLTCNFTPPLDGKPALLTHNELTTLFHEFGHGLHHMATRVDIPSISGINGVAWDAVELPSQIFEFWCWEVEGLSLVSGHVDTGAPLPRSEVDKLRAARNFQVGMQTVRQLEFALLDFRIHHEYSPDGAFDLHAIEEQVRERVAVISPPPWNRFANAFTHIFAGGYAAGYYSYKWAEVLAADAFSLFEERGVFDRDTGDAFLTSVLERGGADEAMALFVNFRGREPKIDALLRLSGLETEQAA